MNEPIKIWPFHEAPEEYQSKAPTTDDADYLALVPPRLVGYTWSLLPPEVCEKWESEPDTNGYVIVVGYHA